MTRQSLTFVVCLLAAARQADRTGTLEAQATQTGRPLTYAADIAPIVNQHCAVCHRPGQAAPFPLLSYDDVKKRGELMLKATERGYMPPWHATASPDFPELRNDRRLSSEEKAALKSWVNSGMPAGDLSTAPKPPSFPDGWALGKPDAELHFTGDVEIPADGPDLYRNVVLPLDLPEDQWITAMDYEPTARASVHHALFFLSPASISSAIRSDEVLPGLSAGLAGGGQRGRGRRGGSGSRSPGGERGPSAVGGWVPGMTPRFFPPGIAQRLPAHSNVVIQLHLHPSGKAQREHGRIAMYFTKAPPSRSLASVQVPPMFGFAKRIDIPPGEARYTVKDSFVLPVDLEAFGARGHAHYLAKEMKMTAALPDGSVRGLLWIGDWDFGWQDSYFYASPFILPKGTRIDVELIYDNSTANIRNPNSPPQRVRWGLGSLDEMGSMTLLGAPRSPGDAAILRAEEALYFRRELATIFLKP